MTDKPQILIVHDDRQVAAGLAARLAAGGYSATSVSTFDEAKAAMAAARPALLITGVRLGAYNGLHLIIRGLIDDPLMAAILVSDRPDPLLEADAATHGALFLAAVDETDTILAVVARALSKNQV